jgi:hypothetical protein
MNTHSLSLPHSKSKVGINSLQTFALNFMSTHVNEQTHEVNLSLENKKVLNINEYFNHPKLIWAFLLGHLWLVRRKMYALACWNAVTLFAFYLLYAFVSYVINPEYIAHAPRMYQSLPWYVLGFYLYQIPASYVFLNLHDKKMLRIMKSHLSDMGTMHIKLNSHMENTENQTIIKETQSNSDIKTILICIALSIVVNLVYFIVLSIIMATTSLGFLYQNNLIK